MILPETDANGGAHFVERLRQILTRHTFPNLGPGRVPEISAGVVAFPHGDVMRPEDLFNLAEGALARSKAEPNHIGIAPGTT
jgi:GGDEF domain-containing protein